jgi:hypothetical protein
MYATNVGMRKPWAKAGTVIEQRVAILLRLPVKRSEVIYLEIQIQMRILMKKIIWKEFDGKNFKIAILNKNIINIY